MSGELVYLLGLIGTFINCMLCDIVDKSIDKSVLFSSQVTQKIKKVYTLKASKIRYTSTNIFCILAKVCAMVKLLYLPALKSNLEMNM